MQLLAAMQLRGSGTGPGQATAWLQAAAWLRMGPMGPRGLGPWALWAPGALGPNKKNKLFFRRTMTVTGKVQFLEGP